MGVGESLFAVATTLPKFAVWGAYSIGHAALYTSVGRFATAAASALVATSYYNSYRKTNKAPEKMADWSRYTMAPEIIWAAGLFASFSIFRSGPMQNLLAGFDATFGGLPYKMVSLCGSGLSSASSYVTTAVTAKVADYMANPIKIADWVVYYVAGNLADRTKAYITNLQLQREIYGYEVGDRAKNLSGVELFNAGLSSIDFGRLLQHIGINPPIPLQLSASFVRQFGMTAFSYLGTPIAYFNNAISIIGITPVANVLTTIASTAFTTTALSAGSIALSGISIGISIVTQVRLADSFSIYNASYEAAIKEQQKAAKELHEKIEYANKLLSEDREEGDKFFSDYAKEPKVKEVLLDFSKFKDKSKSDYIYAFAIKLLETKCGATPMQIKLLMLSVIMNKDNFNNYVAHLADPDKTKIFTGINDFTQHAKSMDDYLTYALNNLGVATEQAEIETSERFIDAPQGTFIAEAEDLRDEIPEKITDFEKDLLTHIDTAVGQAGKQYLGQGRDFAAAVQVLLQKVNAIEKAAPSMMETAANFVAGRSG